MSNNEPIDEVLEWLDYENMPKFELQQRALADDKKAQRIYFERYKNDKVDTVSAKALTIEWIED
jgi:hypothetical protein